MQRNTFKTERVAIGIASDKNAVPKLLAHNRIPTHRKSFLIPILSYILPENGLTNADAIAPGIVWPVVEQLADIKQIACNSGKQVSDFLVIIKCECQFLIMAENVASHVCFHLCTHNMPEIGYVKITEDLQRHKGQH